MVLLSLLVAGLGAATSTAVGLDRGDTIRAHAEQDFHVEAKRLAGAVGTEIRRISDFVENAATYVEVTPELTNMEFDRWSRRTTLERHDSALGFGFIERVPAGDLPGFVAALERDHPVTPDDYAPVPAGPRDHYCLGRFADRGALEITSGLPPTFDYCATAQYDSLLTKSADNGRPVLVALSASTATDRDGSPRGQMFAVLSPVYRDMPMSSAERRVMVRGWIVGVFDGPSIVHPALQGERDALSVEVEWSGIGDHTVVAQSPAFSGARFTDTSVVRADGVWTVRIGASAAGVDAEARRESRTMFAIGAAMTLLVVALLVTILGARNRAFRLVDAKTDELRHQALHDALTGLPNRVLALDRAEQAIARARRERTTPAALFLDVDNFKTINDTAGHGVGDELLQAVASRLRSTVRESETVARLGGDEFVIITDGSALGTGPELLAQRVIDVMAEPFVLASLPSTSLSVAMSIGIAIGDRDDASELLRDADIALYRAKEAGKGRFVVFDAAMQAVVHDRLELELDLHGALDEEQLFLAYQPTFALDDGAVVGVEALLRWQHPTRGLVQPLEFISLAEETGLIVPIGAWVLREACRQAAEWHASGYPVTVAVNVSPRQLDSDDVVHTVQRALAASGLAPSALILEITESTLMEDAAATATRLGALKRLGVRIAIDDFGTGYSSLAYLQQFPVDTLKIDRSFVAAMVSSPESKALVHTLVQLGKTLGLETFAEGIEVDAQLDQLRTESCDMGQGFLFARPLDPAAATAFFATHVCRAAALT